MPKKNKQMPSDTTLLRPGFTLTQGFPPTFKNNTLFFVSIDISFYSPLKFQHFETLYA